MIISHKHRYVYVELPRTGSTAISKELCDNYDGQKILRTHSTLREFSRQASADEKKYFVFSSIRNPLDKTLSLYFKYKVKHRDYTNPKIYKRGNPLIGWLLRRQFQFVQERDASFEEFFRKFYFLPYDDWSSLDHQNLDFVIHFERLSDDFHEALKRIGIDPVRPLPVTNKTAGKEGDFWSHYPPSIQRRARWVFGPYLRRWGYEFPVSWEESEPAGANVAFHFTNLFRQVYWRLLR